MSLEKCVTLLIDCPAKIPLLRRAARLKVAGVIALVGLLSTAVAAESIDEMAAAGELVAGNVCASECHGWDLVFAGPRQLPGQWDFIVTDMASRGASATDEQLRLIRVFLKRTWGAVWVNDASAQDLVTVLALPEKDAEAVIAHRQEHGKFTDLADLRNVPGIDPAKIDAQADAIIFN